MDEYPQYPREEALHPAPRAGGTVRRPTLLVVAAAATVLLGLVLHFFAAGNFANLISDALYTMLLYLVLALILPKAQRAWLALAAFTLSAVIELSQLTGVPAQLAESFPPSRLIFGTTFSAPDLVAYAAGAALIYLADRVLSERAVRWSATQPE